MAKQRLRLRQTLSRLKNFIFLLDFQDIYRYDKPLSPAPDAPSSATFKIYHTLQALEIIEQLNPMSPQERSFAENRLHKGDKAVIGFVEGRPVFYGWLMLEEMEITYGVFANTASGTAFAYNLYTRPSFRRQGAMGAFYRFTADYLKSRDFHTLHCGIATNNTPSIKAHLKNGFDKSGYFYTVKLLGTCFTLANHQDYPKRFSIYRA